MSFKACFYRSGKAKNQNYLRDEDVHKIVLTYRQRLEEEEIDLNAVAQEIREIDREMVETDRLIR